MSQQETRKALGYQQIVGLAAATALTVPKGATLAIGLALTQNVTGTLTGVIPGGSYVQLVTENNTGTPTFTARPGQEVQL
jgi:hypothetical protein